MGGHATPCEEVPLSERAKHFKFVPIFDRFHQARVREGTRTLRENYVFHHGEGFRPNFGLVRHSPFLRYVKSFLPNQ